MGQHGPRMTRPSLIAWFVSLGLSISKVRCALCCCGDLLSMGLIHLADLTVPVERAFLCSMSLRWEGSSVLKQIGTYSTRTGKGLVASMMLGPNFEMKALAPSDERNQSAVWDESTSYRTWPWLIFLAETNCTSSRTMGSSMHTSSRVVLAFSTRTSSFRSLRDAEGSSSGGEILTVLVWAKHLAAAIVGSFCLAASAYEKAWGWGVGS